jgi:hypothetical protein
LVGAAGIERVLDDCLPGAEWVGEPLTLHMLSLIITSISNVAGFG